MPLLSSGASLPKSKFVIPAPAEFLTSFFKPRGKSLPVGCAGPQAKFHYRSAAVQFPAHPPGRHLPSPRLNPF